MVQAAINAATVVGEVLIAGYVLALITYVLARWFALRWDDARYRKFTGVKYSTKW